MKVQLFQSVQTLENNLTKFIAEKKHSKAQDLFEKYSQSLYQYHEIKEEIPWDMLSSLAFVNSICSTTGKKIVTIFKYVVEYAANSATKKSGFRPPATNYILMDLGCRSQNI